MKVSPQRGLIRIGLLSKGIVYFLLGILALLSLVGAGEEISGKKGIVHMIMVQPYGPYIILFLAIGSMIYALWSIVGAIKDHGHKNKTVGYVLRGGEILSGVLYGLFALYLADVSVKHFDPSLGTISSGHERSGVFATLMETAIGRITILVIAVLIGAKGIYSAYTALSGKHKKKVSASGFKPKYKNIVLKSGYFGYLGQAVSAFIITYILVLAVQNNDVSQTGKEEDVFRFVDGAGGALAVGLISFGLFCYGFFMIVQARYGKIKKVV